MAFCSLLADDGDAAGGGVLMNRAALDGLLLPESKLSVGREAFSNSWRFTGSSTQHALTSYGVSYVSASILRRSRG